MLQNSFNARIAEAEEGATAVEYGLLVGLIGVAIIVVVTALGDDLNALFEGASDTLQDATPVTTP